MNCRRCGFPLEPDDLFCPNCGQKAEEAGSPAAAVPVSYARPEAGNEARNIVNDVREEAGEVMQEARAAASGRQLETANIPGAAGYREMNPVSGNGAATASLVLGIMSLVCAFFGYGAILGLIFGVIGTVLGAKARKEAQTGTATGGFVCSIIGTVISGAALVCAIACVGSIASLGSMLGSYY